MTCFSLYHTLYNLYAIPHVTLINAVFSPKIWTKQSDLKQIKLNYIFRITIKELRDKNFCERLVSCMCKSMTNIRKKFFFVGLFGQRHHTIGYTYTWKTVTKYNIIKSLCWLSDFHCTICTSHTILYTNKHTNGMQNASEIIVCGSCDWLRCNKQIDF